MVLEMMLHRMISYLIMQHLSVVQDNQVVAKICGRMISALVTNSRIVLPELIAGEMFDLMILPLIPNQFLVLLPELIAGEMFDLMILALIPNQFLVVLKPIGVKTFVSMIVAQIMIPIELRMLVVIMFGLMMVALKTNIFALMMMMMMSMVAKIFDSVI